MAYMTSGTSLRMPRVGVAALASLCWFAALEMRLLYPLILNRFRDAGEDEVLRIVLAAFHPLFVSGLISLVLLFQIQRHTGRIVPKRPWLVVLAFAGLDLVSRYGGRDRLPLLLYASMQRHGYDNFAILWNELLESCVSLGSMLIFTLVCAWIAVALGGREEIHAEDELDFPEPEGVLWAWVQAATVGLGLYCVTQLMMGLHADRVLMIPMRSALAQQFVPTFVALLGSLLFSGVIYRLWPARLKRASGLSLFMLGVLLGGFGVLLTAVLALIAVFTAGPLALVILVLFWPIYLVGICLGAGVIGMLGRKRSGPLSG